MLSVKPWRWEAMLRYAVGVFVCAFIGSLVMSAVVHAPHAKVQTGFYALGFVSVGLMAATLVLLIRRWTLENFIRRMIALMICFYAGVILGAWAEKIAAPKGIPLHDARELIISGLSLQGAALVLSAFFVREHGWSVRDAFGLSNQPGRAISMGVLVAMIFLPVGVLLQVACGILMTHFHLQPEEQQAVEVLRTVHGWSYRVCLGIVTILLAPLAEETLFRGILYPAIKQAGYPRLAYAGTALLFAAVHLNLVTFVPLFVLALILALLYERMNNLLAPIATHALFNTMNFTMLYLQQTTDVPHHG